MSTESGAAFRAPSPADSGRNSPLLRLSKQADEEINPKDRSSRRYAHAVDRALASFESTQQEWADYISFLARLLKALQSKPNESQNIPHNYAVATRLAQCLSPTLPPGVHRKTLGVYNYIFEAIGPSNLERDLHLYLPGISAVLSFASLAVRPEYLRLLETHILPLHANALRSPLKAIILCILPGLEDPSSEDYEEWMSLLHKFRVALRDPTIPGEDQNDDSGKDSFFWQSLFLAVMTNPSRRQGALSYLARELPKFGDLKRAHSSHEPDTILSAAATAALSPEPGLLIRCMSAGLSDSQLLVQRGFLDLLVLHLPLNSSVLQKTVSEVDLDRLVFAATGVVGRRDMSLNRRLWAWFLGPDAQEDNDAETPSTPPTKYPTTEGSPQAAHFARFGLQPMIRSIKRMFNNDSASAIERAKPFRLCLSLMDRWEVGGLLIADILIPALASAYNYSKTADASDTDEVLKSASNFFDGIESGLIWSKFNDLVTDAFHSSAPDDISPPGRPLELCSFVVRRFNIREEEMVVHHIPMSCLFILAEISRSLDATSADESTETEAMDIVERLFTLVPTRAFAGPHKASDIAKRRSHLDSISTEQIVEKVNGYYRSENGGQEYSSPFSPTDIATLILRESTELILDLCSRKHTSASLDVLTKLVCSMLAKIPTTLLASRQEILLSELESCFEKRSKLSGAGIVPFRVVAAISSVLATLQSTDDHAALLDMNKTSNLQTMLVRSAWDHLSPDAPKHHVEAVRCLWQLEKTGSPRNLVEATITTILSDSLATAASTQAVEDSRRFAVLWTHSTQDKPSAGEKAQKGVIRRASSAVSLHGQFIIPTDPSNVLSRPLLLLLDHIGDEGTQTAAFIQAWLQEMPSLSKVFNILIERLRALKCLQQGSDPHHTVSRGNHTDSLQCLYYLKQLLAIVKHASEYTWITLAGELANPLEAITDDGSPTPIQVLVVQIAARSLEITTTSSEQTAQTHVKELHRVSLVLILALLQGPFPQSIKDLHLERVLLQRLHDTVDSTDDSTDALLQPILLETITAAIRLRFAPSSLETPSPPHIRKGSKDLSLPVRLSLPRDSMRPKIDPGSRKPPVLLVDCLKAGFESKSSRAIIDSWVLFLVEVLPYFADTIFENLIPLVECLCFQIKLVFGQMKSIFQNINLAQSSLPEPTLIGLLNGLEHLLANAHERLVNDEGKTQHTKSPEPQQGFFGNMVQGVFAGENERPSRSAVANSRLTVLLCFQDAVRTCFYIWCWGTSDGEKQDSSSLASLGYTALRMRNRARRLLEHLFAAEALECMETVATLWCNPSGSKTQAGSVLRLLNVLNGSKPKHTIPAIFNAIYSRTNPSALEPSKQSSLTSELQDGDLVAFLIDYIKTVDDDAMDEIWNDCVAFLKDVLGNPLPHSQILPSLLVFTALLAEKVDNTNFGEQRRMRKELGDLFSRLLTATFTTRPMGFLQEPSPVGPRKGHVNGHSRKREPDVLSALATVTPLLKLVLIENDRIQNAVNSITANVTGPTLRAKTFPTNIDTRFLGVLESLTTVPQAAKLWKKDVLDAINDSRFFAMPLDLVHRKWLPILQAIANNDKDRMPELLSRLPPPTSAGIVFGVGATSARNEADRRTQLNLRRIAVLILASPVDTFAQNFPMLYEKVTELLSATQMSSPSAATRADLFVLLRVLFLKISPIHLVPLWPTVNSELQSCLLSILPDNPDHEKYSNASVIQACKVLDTLTTLDLEDFQLHEWLFITDTIDAVYKSSSSISIALVDSIADKLSMMNTEADASEDMTYHLQNTIVTAGGNMRTPIMDGLLASVGVDMADMRAMQKQDLATRVLSPFFGQLSLLSFEATYGMLGPDVQSCLDGVLKDLFEEGGDSLP